MNPLSIIAIAAAVVLVIFSGLVVLGDVLTYRDLQKRLRKEREAKE